MVGIKTKLNQSLQTQLSFWLASIVLVLALVAGTISFATSFKEMNEIQDDLLRQIASLFDADHLPIAHHGDSGRLAGSNEESRVIVQYLNKIESNIQSKDGSPLNFSSTLADGLQTIHVENESYRVLVKTMSNGDRIAIAQETAIRDDIAEAAALRTLIPFLILLPISFVTIAILVRVLFKPVKTLSEEINRRSEHDLHAIETQGLPSEISPFVIAINCMLDRVSKSMLAQRRFVADAAHELRSPMTALSLQAEHLANSEMSDQAKERVQSLRLGIERGRHLLSQLLEFARIQSKLPANTKAVSIKSIYRNVLEDLHALADAKQIDIGVLNDNDVEVTTDETELFIVIKNLVDNAIRYTPNGGEVNLGLKIDMNQIYITVTDSGPGISIEDRQRVMDPFYRIVGSHQTGSGLGLSIVNEIATKMGWHVSLGYADEVLKKGLMVTVTIQN